MTIIVNFLLNRVARPYTLFVGIVVLATLLASSHLVTQGCSYLVSYFWESEGCTGMFKAAGVPMIPAVEIQYSVLFLLVQY